MAKGSNDLNMLLKSEVIKIRAEIDIGKSLPVIRKQITRISERLKDRPVRLRVQLDYRLGELRKQMNILQTSLQTAKTIQPIKLRVQIDVAGSAVKIKKQLQSVYKTVEDFNRKYAEQIRKMHQQTQQASTSASVGAGASTGSVIGGFNLDQYASSVNQAKKLMKDMFGDGNFTSFEMRNANNELTGFVGHLEKANGVVQKIRYEWDAKAQQFTPINRQTINSIEKHVSQAGSSLRKLYIDIDKLDKGTARSGLFKQYEQLEKQIGKGTLTKGAVNELKSMIAQEKHLQGEVKKTNNLEHQRKRLLQDIKVQSYSIADAYRRIEYKPLLNRVKNASLEELKNIRLESNKLTQEIKRQEKAHKEALNINKQRNALQREFNRLQKTVSSYAVTDKYMKETEAIIKTIRKTKDLEVARKRLDKISDSKWAENNYIQTVKVIDKIKIKLDELRNMSRITGSSYNRQMRLIADSTKVNLGDAQRQLHGLTRAYDKAVKQQQSKPKVLLDSSTKSMAERSLLSNIQGAVRTGDTERLQKYIGQLYKGKVATLDFAEAHHRTYGAVDRIRVKMAGAGKTVQAYTLDLARSNGTLRQLNQGLDFNANRNLGVFEQLKIAMKRVPVWMGAMTAFYGTIRSVRAMSREIMEIDKALTEIRRVASEGINIDNIFKGAVRLSGDLGNNIHDIMETLGDFARTFGDFNERQLLAITNTATLMSNVSELSTQEAGQTLIATMNAFNIEAEESIRIVDVLNEVDNNFAVSTRQLAEGMEKSASTAKTFGVTMEETAGHITAISSVTMESGKIIGNSLKTIYSRLTTMKPAQKALEDVGVAIYQIGEDGKKVIKPVNNILGDLAGKWHELEDAQRQHLGVQLAGRFQLSRFLALMNNWEIATEATTTALLSEGSAMRENAEYMKSFEARVNKLKNAFTEMSLAIGESFLSGSILLAIEGLAKLAQIATDLAEKYGALPVIFFGLGAILTSMGAFKKNGADLLAFFQLMKVGFKEASVGMVGFRANIAGTTGALSTFSTIAPSFSRAGRIIASTFRTIIASTVIGLAFVGIGMLIEWVIGKAQDAKRLAEEVEENNKKLIDSYRNTEKTIHNSEGTLKGLVEAHAELQEKVDSKQIKEGTDAYNEYLEVNQELAKQMPNMVKYIDSKGLAHMNTTKLMLEEVKVAEELSKIEAEYQVNTFKKNIDAKVESIRDLGNEWGDAQEKLAKYQEEHGKDITVSNFGRGGANVSVVTGQVDNNDKIKEYKQLVANLNQEIQKMNQEAVLMINDTVFASLEADGILKNMTDTQRTSIERFAQSNEKFLMEISEKYLEIDYTAKKKVIEEQTEAIDAELAERAEQLASAGAQIGEIIDSKYQDMIKGVVNKDEIEKISASYDYLLDSLPKTFFSPEMIDNVDLFADKLQGVIEVSEQANDPKANFHSMTAQLEKLGYAPEEAIRQVARLAFEHDNSALKAEAYALEAEGVIDSLEDLIETTIEAIDVTATFLGQDDNELSAVLSHIDRLKLMIELNEENKEMHKESITAIADHFHKTNEFVEENIDTFEEFAKLMSEWKPEYDEDDNLEKSFVEKWEKIKKLAKELEIELPLTADAFQVEEVNKKIDEKTDKTKKDTDAIKENEEAIKKQAEAVNILTGKFTSFKSDMGEVSRSDYLQTLSEQLHRLDGDITIVKDETTGALKLAMSDGTESVYLNTLQTQLSELGIDIGLMKDESGELKLVLNDGTGSTTIAQIGEDAEDAKFQLGEMVKEVDIIHTRKNILPDNWAQIDFKSLFSGLDTTVDKVTFVSDALATVWGKVADLTKLDGMLDDLITKSSTLEDVLLSAFESNKGTLEDLGNKADEVKTKIDKLRDSLRDVSGKARKISLTGLDKIVEDSESAITSLVDLGLRFKALESRSSDLSETMNDLNRVLANIANFNTDNLSDYIRELGILAGNLESVVIYGKRTIDSQNDVIQTFSNAFNMVKSYNVSMQDASTNTQGSFQKMANHVETYTKEMISQYDRNKARLSNMVDEVRDLLDDMILDFTRTGTIATSRVTTMASAMHREFKSGMDKIVTLAGGVPERIGNAIRTNMSYASSSMDAVAKDMVSRFKKELGIHSPSTVFTDLGGWVIKGLANGLTGENLKSLGKSVFNDFGGGALASWENIKDFLTFGSIAPNFGGSFSETSPFGMRRNPITGEMKHHAGIDYGAPLGTPIPAQMGGKVIRSTYAGGYGNLVEIQGLGGMSYIYAHNSRNMVNVGDRVSKGQIIGLVGSTGNSTGAHVHYEVRKNGRPINVRGKFAKGGFIDEHMIAEMGEEGEEVIIPLISKRRQRGIELWQEAGERLGINTSLLELLKPKKGSGGAGVFGNMFGALSGESGSEGSSSGNTGSSGKIKTPLFDSGLNLDGIYTFRALAEKRADLFKWNANERSASAYEANISLLELKMNNLTENTLKYRNALKEVIAQQNKLHAVNKKDLAQTEKRQKAIEKQIKGLGSTSKHSVKQREKYNELQQEYASNISKIQGLKNSIESVSQSIKAKSLEIFTDFIDEIATNYEQAISIIQRKTETIQFKFDVLGFTDPNNVKEELNLLVQKATSIQGEQSSTSNLRNAMKKEYDKAVKKHGKNSAQAKKVKEELDKADKALEDVTLKVLQAEKDIIDVRGRVADEGINQLKNYYGNMKDMAIKAIDAEQKALKDAHDDKMKMYDEEIKKINSVYDEKFKAMDEESSELSYQEELEEKRLKRAELINRKALLSRDTSLDGKKKLAEIEKELEEVDKDLTKFQKDRHNELLRKSLEDQKQAQIDAIDSKKEFEETEHERQIRLLEEEKEIVTKKYEDLINNDRKWAEMRDEFTKGNFNTLHNELRDMEKTLNNMGKGIFDGLTVSFNGFSAEVKQQVKEMNALIVDNMKLSSKPVIDDVKGVKDAKKPTITDGKQKATTPIATPKQTATPAKPKPTPAPKPAPAKNSGASSLPLTKQTYATPKGGWDKNSVVDYIKSKGYRAELSDRSKLFKHLKGSGAYTGTAKQNDWLLKQLKIAGLRKGGYTGENEGLAYLHPREVVLNERQTSDYFEFSKVMEKILKTSGIKRNSISEKLVTTNSSKVANSYGDIIVNIENGNKKKGKEIATEIMDKLKKRGI